MGYLLVTAVLVISLGRLGDIVGRVRIFNLGFAVFSVGVGPARRSIPSTAARERFGSCYGDSSKEWAGRCCSPTRAPFWSTPFPVDQRGLAMGVNQVAAIGGSFIGLIAGGLLSVVDWRLVFWVSVPFGIIGTVWSYIALRDNGIRSPAKIDWWGNLTFAVGLTTVLVGIVYGIEPYGGHSMGWTSPLVLSAFALGVVFLAAFFVIETKVEAPMFNLRLFRIRAFFMGIGRRVSGGDRARRTAVHAHHLAPGDLAAAARLQLLRHATVGGYLPPSSHGRLSPRRTVLGILLRSPRRSHSLDHGAKYLRAQLRRTAARADQLLVLGLRPPGLRQRRGRRHVLRAERGRRDELRTAPISAAVPRVSRRRL